MPFLPYPENLKGYVGDDIGFDPLGISTYFPMDYLREAELKHGRIAMMAWLGFVSVDLGLVFHPYGQGLSSVEAHDVLAEKGVMGNALVWIGAAEIVSYIGIAEMLQGSGREPGDFGVGKFYLMGKNEEKINKLKYQEINVSGAVLVVRLHMIVLRRFFHVLTSLLCFYRMAASQCLPSAVLLPKLS
jgi:uncharacterized protein (DUF2164 family)